MNTESIKESLLSYIQQMLDSIDKSELSVSKYCMARQISYQTHL